MKRILFLTPPDARHGFSLTGVEQRVVAPADLKTQLAGAIRDPAAGVVVIDERLLDSALRTWLESLARSWAGVLVVLPSPQKPAQAAEDYALQLIRRAIGYQVRVSL